MGNEASQSTVCGEVLQNDMKVSWRRIKGEGVPLQGRDGHCACACNGKLYVFGGVIQNENEEHVESNELIVFNPISDSYESIVASGDIPPPRSSASLASVASKIYLFGGLSNNSGWLQDIHVYDTEMNHWAQLETSGKSPSPRDKVTSSVIGKNIYIFGGFGPKATEDDDEDDVDDDEADDDDELSDEEAAKFGWFDDLFIFDTENNSWSQPIQLNKSGASPRAAHSCCPVGDHLIIFGGRDSQGRTNDLHIFDTTTRKWISDLVISGRYPNRRSFHTATAVGSRMVILGGRGVDDQHFSDCHIFDAATRQWIQPKIEGDVWQARGVHTTTLVNNQIILFAGSSEFDKESLQCKRYHNDFYVMSSDDIQVGGAIQTISANQENISSSANQEPTCNS